MTVAPSPHCGVCLGTGIVRICREGAEPPATRWLTTWAIQVGRTVRIGIAPAPTGMQASLYSTATRECPACMTTTPEHFEGRVILREVAGPKKAAEEQKAKKGRKK